MSDQPIPPQGRPEYLVREPGFHCETKQGRILEVGLYLFVLGGAAIATVLTLLGSAK